MIFLKYKSRTLFQIVRHLQQAQEALDRFHIQYSAWYKKAQSIHVFYGLKDLKKEKTLDWSNYNVITIDEGLNFKNIFQNNDYKTFVALTEDYTLLIGDPSWTSPEAVEALEKRCKNIIKPIPHRQDLHDEYLYYERRFEHYYRVIRKYEKLLTEAIREKYFVEIYNKYQQPLTLILTIENQIYHFRSDHSNDFYLDKNNLCIETIKKDFSIEHLKMDRWRN